LPPELLLLAQICTKSFVGWGSLVELTALPRPSSWFRGWGPGEREGDRGGGSGKGVPKCPNPELASLALPKSVSISDIRNRPGSRCFTSL